MTLDEAIKLVTKCLMNDLEATKKEASIRIAVVPAETKRLTMFTADKYKKAVEKIDKINEDLLCFAHARIT